MKSIQRYFLFFLNVIIMMAMCFAVPDKALAHSPTSTGDQTISPPLFSGLTWKNLGNIKKDLRINDRILTFNGGAFESDGNVQSGNLDDVFEYYSSENLQSLGWTFVGGVGVELIYQDISGAYLTIQISKCANSETNYCVNVWQSADGGAVTSSDIITLSIAFGKTTPANGATIPFPSTTFQLLQWGDAEISSSDRYQYCIDETNNSTCDSNNWITRNSLYSGPGDFALVSGHTYYWQVRVRDAGTTANSGTWWSFTVVPIFPIVASIVRGIPSSSITRASAVSFTVTFDQSVTGVDISDFVLTTTGAVAGASIGAVGGSGNVYTVLVNTGTGSGTIRLDVVDNDSIKNSTNSSLGGTGAGNGSFITGEFYTMDWTPPTVTNITRLSANPLSNSTVDFTVTFSEVVTGVDTADFTLTTTGVAGTSVTGVNGSGATRTVTVNTGSGNGTIRLDLVDNNSIMDVFTNLLGGASVGDGNFTAGEIFTIIKSANGDKTGVFRPSNGLLYLKNVNTTGFANISINYGLTGDYPVTGDWDGNGTDTIGIYRNGSFYLRNSNTLGFADIVFAFGMPGDQPIAGDWNNDGTDTIGIFRPSIGQFLLRNSNTTGTPDASFYLGNVGDVGIAGDWNGDGVDTTGVFRPSNGVLFMKNTNTSGFADIAINYGIPGDQPVTGDWNYDGIDTIGVYRNGTFYLRNSNTLGFADLVFALGIPGDMPIAGNWDGLP